MYKECENCKCCVDYDRCTAYFQSDAPENFPDRFRLQGEGEDYKIGYT